MGRKYANLNLCLTPWYSGYGVQGGYFFTYHADDYYLFTGRRDCGHVIGNYLCGYGVLNSFVHYVEDKRHAFAISPPISGKMIVHVEDILGWLRLCTMNNRTSRDGRFNMRVKTNISRMHYRSLEVRYQENFKARERARSSRYRVYENTKGLRNSTEFFQDKLDLEIRKRYNLQ